MIGHKNFFFSHLQSEVSGIILLLNCICYSTAIVASKACEELPKSYEKLIRVLPLMFRAVQTDVQF